MSRWITAGLRSSFHDTVRELVICCVHRRGVWRARRLRGRSGLKLHLGCGGKLKEGWVNVDLALSSDLTLDVREPLPFADGSCAVIYSEHFLEHLDYPQPTRSLLEECRRVLEPGGRFSVGVPDTEWPLREYFGLQDDDYFRTARERWHPPWCETRMEQINYHFRQVTEHRFAYDYETLERMLERVGFTEIHRRRFDPALDSEDRRLGTLYVDAVNPGPPGPAAERRKGT
jgi:predicted SAM-dependent methyltransferase